MVSRHRLTGILWTLRWFAIVALVAFAVDMLYVFWPYPNGPRGVESLARALARERELVRGLADERSLTIVSSVEDAAYRLCFVWSGLDGLMSRFTDPAPLAESEEAMRRLFLSHWAFLETAVYGLQLFGMRLGVLLLALPLFVLAGLGAAADGLVTWYRRRSSAGRESGFVYHRVKRVLAIALLVQWMVYLLPPVVLDLRHVLPPFLIVWALGIRLAAAYFKKHL